MTQTYLENSRWITFLPAITVDELSANAAIGMLVEEANALEAQARAKKQEAYQQAKKLERQINEKWSSSEVKAAQEKAKHPDGYHDH